MKHCMLVVAGMSVFALWGSGRPVVSNVKLQQKSYGAPVSISYDVDAPAIVTLRILVDGEALPGQVLWNATGDLNKQVTAGSHVIDWMASRSWPSNATEHAQAEITAWCVDMPPTYCGVDLKGGAPYGVSYYATEGDVPGGVTNSLWKDERMLFKKCEPTDGGGFAMGSLLGVTGDGSKPGMMRTHAYEKSTRVYLTKPFWLGVYEVTQGQWLRVVGNNPSLQDQKTDPHGHGGAWRPVSCISRFHVRGGADWPKDRSVSSDSFVGLLRARAGLKFDLPTEAQWEYACRAGEDAGVLPGEQKEYNSWTFITNEVQTACMMRHLGNRYSDGFSGSGDVGLYAPNPWGFYDMVGNVWEWCLDRFVENRQTLANCVDPEPSTDDAGTQNYTIRGGSFWETYDTWDPNACRCAARHPLAEGETASSGGNLGCRILFEVEE